jgi:hypothetical protein
MHVSGTSGKKQAAAREPEDADNAPHKRTAWTQGMKELLIESARTVLSEPNAHKMENGTPTRMGTLKSSNAAMLELGQVLAVLGFLFIFFANFSRKKQTKTGLFGRS